MSTVLKKRKKRTFTLSTHDNVCSAPFDTSAVASPDDMTSLDEELFSRCNNRHVSSSEHMATRMDLLFTSQQIVPRQTATAQAVMHQPDTERLLLYLSYLSMFSFYENSIDTLLSTLRRDDYPTFRCLNDMLQIIQRQREAVLIDDDPTLFDISDICHDDDITDAGLLQLAP